MKGEGVLYSSNSDEWGTPGDLFATLNAKHNFTLDPCATDDNHVCDKYYTREIDGLTQDWSNETVFVNPPFSQISKWVEKAWVEMIVHNVKTVMLLPARTDTKWFHNYIYNVENVSIEFLRGRLKFGESKNSAPFPSMIVVFDPKLTIVHVEYSK
jgi:phage N-6-adenine-methyltransferase